MPVSEILIVYFAFGAPLAVYRYLETRRVGQLQRSLLALGTFLFWIPYAIRLGFRHFTNASSAGDFVSPARKNKLDNATRKRNELVRIALIRAGCPLSLHDLRDRIDRYVGLSEAAGQDSTTNAGEKAINFFKAAGRNHQPAAACLTRRDKARLITHLAEARRSFLELFEQLPESASGQSHVVRRGLELALILEDMEAADYLGEIGSRVEDYRDHEAAFPATEPQTTRSIDASSGIRETTAQVS